MIFVANWLNGSRINETHSLDSLLTNLLIVEILQAPDREIYNHSIELNKQKEWRERNRIIKGYIDKCLRIGTNK